MYIPCPICRQLIDILVSDGSCHDGFDSAVYVEINERTCGCPLTVLHVHALLDAAAVKATQRSDVDEDHRRCDWR